MVFNRAEQSETDVNECWDSSSTSGALMQGNTIPSRSEVAWAGVDVAPLASALGVEVVAITQTMDV